MSQVILKYFEEDYHDLKVHYFSISLILSKDCV